MNTTNNKSMKLILEDNFNNIETIISEKEGSKEKLIKIRGPYFMVNYINGNNRIYLDKDIDPAINNYIKEKINNNCAYGELEHRDSFEVDLNKVCHRVISLKKAKPGEYYKDENIPGEYYIGESIILTGSPNGDILASIIKTGGKIGISSRSVGVLANLEDGDYQYLREKNIDVSNQQQITKVLDPVISCFDVVSTPSIKQFVDGIVAEKEYYIDKYGVIVEKVINKLEKDVSNLPKKISEKEEKIKKAINEFINNYINLKFN